LRICQLTRAEGEMVEHHGFRPDCNQHGHLSRGDAQRRVDAGNSRFVSRRAVVVVSSVPPPGKWYDEAVEKNDRHLGIAKSGRVSTFQLLNFMPRGLKHRVRGVGARGAHGRLMTAKAVNDVSPATNRVGDQE